MNSSKGAAIRKILDQFAILKQATFDAEYWHGIVVTELRSKMTAEQGQAQEQHEVMHKAAQKVYEETVTHANQVHNRKIADSEAELQRAHGLAQTAVEQAVDTLGILSADWNSSLWDNYQPTLRGADVNGCGSQKVNPE